MDTLNQLISITSHASGAVIARVSEIGLVEFAVMEYQKGKYISLRHMMETGEPGENAHHTLENGLKHEVARNAIDFRFRTVERNPIMTKFSRDERNQGGTHLKAMFLVEIIAGELRNFDLHDGDELLRPMQWIEAHNVLRRMEGHTPPFHTSACYAALEKLSRNPSVFSRYQNLVTRWSPPELHSDKQLALEAYLNRR